MHLDVYDGCDSRLFVKLSGALASPKAPLPHQHLALTACLAEGMFCGGDKEVDMVERGIILEGEFKS